MKKGQVTKVKTRPKNRMLRPQAEVEAEAEARLRAHTPLTDEQEQDQFASQMVVWRPEAIKSESRVGHFGARNSRFWIRDVSDGIADKDPVGEVASTVEDLKKQFEPRVLEHVDAEVQARLETFRDEFPPELERNIETVREFFLTNLAPLTLAASAGLSQSRDVVKQITESEVDPALLIRFEEMVNRATVIRMAQFVLDYLSLPAEHLHLLFSSQGAGGADLSKLVSMMKETMELPRQDPTGRLHHGKTQPRQGSQAKGR